MSPNYDLAHSICAAVAWDRRVIELARGGVTVAEIDERCDYLGLSGEKRIDVITLALDLCTAVSERDTTHVRLLASKPSIVPQSCAMWGIGQEWLELIRNAEKRIVIISPSMDAAAVTNMQDALSAAYSDDVSLTVLYGALGRRERLHSAIEILRLACPGAELLEWPTERGFLHAKAIYADDSIIYIGSANITEFGWEKNVELGITLSGVMAQPLIRYCNSLTELAREERVRLYSVNGGRYSLQ